VLLERKCKKKEEHTRKSAKKECKERAAHINVPEL
jgi:hypothetical protein